MEKTAYFIITAMVMAILLVFGNAGAGVLDEAIQKFKPGMAESEVLKQYTGTKGCGGMRICDNRSYFMAGAKWMLYYLLDDNDNMLRMVFTTGFNDDVLKKILDYLTENKFIMVAMINNEKKELTA